MIFEIIGQIETTLLKKLLEGIRVLFSDEENTKIFKFLDEFREDFLEELEITRVYPRGFFQ